ncbi:MAG: hypothetical protein VX768_10735, partial [Planctomycetota bacterium]|nr:hypothetical protein [Planctomycetota bacterium]
MRSFFLFSVTVLIATSVMVCSGCGEKTDSGKADRNEENGQPGESDSTSQGGKKTAAKSGKEGEPAKKATKIVKKSFSSGSGNTFATQSFLGGDQRRTQLTQSVLEYAQESQESNPTVVIWLLDQTPSAKKLREKVVSEIMLFQPDSNNADFESLVVGFSGDGLNIATKSPTSDPKKIGESLEGLEESEVE